MYCGIYDWSENISRRYHVYRYACQIRSICENTFIIYSGRNKLLYILLFCFAIATCSVIYRKFGDNCVQLNLLVEIKTLWMMRRKIKSQSLLILFQFFVRTGRCRCRRRSSHKTTDDLLSEWGKHDYMALHVHERLFCFDVELCVTLLYTLVIDSMSFISKTCFFAPGN